MIMYTENVSTYIIFILQNNKIMNQTMETVIEQNYREPGSLQILGMPIYYFSFIAIFLFLITYFKMAKNKNPLRNEIVLVGERNAGKSQLFITLCDGKKFRTIPSIRDNSTQYLLNGKPYKLIDYHGDAISKQQILGKINQVYCIVHVIDGTDPETFTDAAMFIYRTLINTNYQRKNCEYLIFINKNDDKKFIGINKIKQRIQDEIEHIKQSRINSGEEDKEGEQDFIKLSKGRYSVPFKFVEGSAESNIKDLTMSLQSL